jgi:hypothetical protein
MDGIITAITWWVIASLPCPVFAPAQIKEQTP